MIQPKVVVQVGYRKAALRAAQEMGIDVVGVTHESKRGLPAGLADLHVLAADAPADQWKRLAFRIGTVHNVVAVIPLTEASVLPAAWIREALGVAGQRADSARNFRDKVRMKRTIRGAGLPCAEFVADEEGLSGERIVARLGLPLMVKPRDSFGGRGARVVHQPAELKNGLAPGWMAESFLTGTEMSVETFVAQGAAVFVNCTEYVKKRHCNVVPARLQRGLKSALERFNEKVQRALGIERGITHLEVFLQDGGILFGEVAARPPGGHIMRLIQLAHGFDPWRTLLQAELGGQPEIGETSRRCSGVWIVHPGAGTVTDVQGRDRVEALPGFVESHFRIRPGSRVEERLGSGQEVGHFIFAANRRSDVVAALTEARRLLRIEMG